MSKSVVSFLVIAFVATSSFAQLWIIDPLEAIYPDLNDLSNYNNTWKADFPTGVVADAHVLVKIPKGSSFTISAFKDGVPFNVNYLSQLIDVPVEQNTGLDSRTEQFINKKNPFVIRRAPFRIFEVIQPMQHSKVVATSNFTAFRLSIPPDIIDKRGIDSVLADVRTRGDKV